MKKTISFLISLSLVITVVPFIASAQTVDNSQTIITTLLQQLLTLYTQELASLEQQLATMQANQTSMQNQINSTPTSTLQTSTAGITDQTSTSTESSTTTTVATSTYTPSQTLTQIQTVSPEVVTSTQVAEAPAPAQPTSTIYHLYSGGLTTFPSSYQYTKLPHALWFQVESCINEYPAGSSAGWIQALLTSTDLQDNSGYGFVTVSTDTTTGATLFSFGPDSLQTILQNSLLPMYQKQLIDAETGVNPNDSSSTAQGTVDSLQAVTFPISCASGTIEVQ
jgi:hypothetical protein